MIITLRRIFEWIMLFIFFLLFTVILYKLLLDFSTWINPIDKYKAPIRESIKVIDMGGGEKLINKLDFVERLKFFYWVGE